MQRKILILITASVLISLASLGLISHYILRHSIQSSFEDHSTMASILGREISYNLESNIRRLLDVHISGKMVLDDSDWEPEREALRDAYRYSIFTDGMFIVGPQGDVLLTYPYRPDEMVNSLSVPVIGKALFSGKVTVSDVYTDSRTMRKSIFVIAPAKDPAGRVIGAVGGRVDPTNYIFSQAISSAGYEYGTVIEIVDSRGAVIASNKLDRVLTLSDHNKFMGELIADGEPTIVRCHRCHVGQDTEETPERSDILAFSPLKIAPWGVAVRLPEEVAFRPTNMLIKAFMGIGIVIVASSFFLALVISRRITRPVTQLTHATRMISAGDLSRPVAVEGSDEVGELARSLEAMRKELERFVGESRDYSSMLETEVRERTDELVLRKQQLDRLLDELIKSQEDERRRIAQELHDDTVQTIAALGMSIEVAATALSEGSLSHEMLMELREKVGGLLDDIGRIIKNLRPPVLDDLGLEAAVQWVIERQISRRGIGYYLDMEGVQSCLFNRQAELWVFRILQEALLNIARHSEATHVSVAMRRKDDGVAIEVIDNGIGFDVEAINELDSDDGLKGVGLLGIRERVAQLKGELKIVSAPGEGAAIYITVPITNVDTEVPDAKA